MIYKMALCATKISYLVKDADNKIIVMFLLKFNNNSIKMLILIFFVIGIVIDDIF